MRRWLITAFSLCPLHIAMAGCEAVADTSRAGILELYTSEGCSSCPPAERWLGSLTARQKARSGWVPLAFHVDYWDGLGWKDPYARAEFSARQRERAGRRGWVYTPQFLFDGADLPAAARAVPPPAPTGGMPLRLALTPGTDSLGASLSLPDLPAGTRAYLALYENGLVTAVPAGENAGRTLHHDYVVRQLAGPFPGQTSLNWTFNLAPGWARSRLGVAAWVETPDGRSLQAVAAEGCQTKR